jgi:hypothetical protein
MTGLRQGELIALRWRDVDWLAGRVRVRQNYVVGEFGTPKSRRSTRSVPMADAVGAELERLFQATGEPDDDALVFADPLSAEPLSKAAILRRYRRALKAARLDTSHRFHDLRDAHGGCGRADALVAGVDGAPRHLDDAEVRRLRAQRARGRVHRRRVGPPVRAGLRPAAVARAPRDAAAVAPAARDLRELDVGPVPRGDPRRLRRARLRRDADHHVFQVLTKRHDRLAALAPDLPWPPNVWMGVSIENRRFVHRADRLREVPAAVRFISAEPLLGPLEGLDLTGVHWLIAGGESGPRHRPVRAEWLRDLRDRCVDEGVAYFFKQWGGTRPKSGGRELDGRNVG